MNSRQRVLSALMHKESDRVPIDFGGTLVTSIHSKAYLELKKRLGLCEDKPVVDMLKTAGFARPDDEIQRHLHADVRGVFPHRVYTIDSTGN